MKSLLYPFYRLLYRWNRFLHLRFTPAGKLVLCGILAAAILGLDTRRTMTYQVFTLLSALLLLSLFRMPGFHPAIRIIRRVSDFGTAGEPLWCRLRIVNESTRTLSGLAMEENPDIRLPDRALFLSAREPMEQKRNYIDRLFGFYRWLWLVNLRTIAKPTRIFLPDLPPGEPVDIKIPLLPLRRGNLRLNRIHILRPDPLGLGMAVHTMSLPAGTAILPRPMPVPDVSFFKRGRRHQSGNIGPTSSAGDSEEFQSLREYRPGDPPRRIHWRSWARTGRPVVQEFQEEYFIRHSLILDTFCRTEREDRFETAISLAASFIRAERPQDSLLDLMFMGHRFYRLTCGRGLGHSAQALKALAAARPLDRDEISGLTASAALQAGGLSGTVVILLEWEEKRARLVEKLSILRVPVAVLLIRGEDDPPVSEIRNLHPVFSRYPAHIIGVPVTSQKKND